MAVTTGIGDGYAIDEYVFDVMVRQTDHDAVYPGFLARFAVSSPWATCSRAFGVLSCEWACLRVSLLPTVNLVVTA